MHCQETLRASAVLDTSILAELRGPGEDDGFRDVVDAFLLDLPERVAALDAALAARATGMVSREAHTLKGCASAVGAIRLTAVCVAIEQEVRRGSLDAALTHRSELSREFGAARQALEHMR